MCGVWGWGGGGGVGAVPLSGSWGAPMARRLVQCSLDPRCSYNHLLCSAGPRLDLHTQRLVFSKACILKDPYTDGLIH